MPEIDKTEKRKPGPKPGVKTIPERAAQLGTKEGEERFSFITKTQHIEDLKNVAYWSRIKHYKTVIDNAFTQYIETWKKDPANKQHVSGGKIKQRPDGE